MEVWSWPSIPIDSGNLGKKQKWCSLRCPWSQVQQVTSGPDNFRILGCLWTIHHRCTCKWDWTEMSTVSFPLRAKTVWNPLRIKTERCRPPWRRGSGLDCGSEDPGSIPGLTSPPVGPLMARRLKTSSDVPVPVSG